MSRSMDCIPDFSKSDSYVRCLISHYHIGVYFQGGGKSARKIRPIWELDNGLLHVLGIFIDFITEFSSQSVCFPNFPILNC